MNLLRFILLPFSPIFGLIILVRNFFFDVGIFSSKKVNAQVISVGNLTVGGSGKTPLVIYLTNLFKKKEHKVGVLSRGYGRKTSGYILVSDGTKALRTVEESGDEIYHTFSECNVPAAVSENRVRGAKRFLKEADINTIVLDDAFQHRWIKRDVDLLIIDQNFLNKNDLFEHSLLPAGMMRETFSSIKRADAVILNRKFSDKKEIISEREKYLKNKPVFSCYYEAGGFVDVKRNIIYDLKDFKGQKGLIVSGIANPRSFIKVLRKNDVDAKNGIIFGDHKAYTLKEIQRIRKEFYATNSHSVITTAKDGVKLFRFAKEFDDIDIFYLKINLRMDDEESFIQYLFNKLSN